MRVIITAKNLEHSQALDDFVQNKFIVLKKYINILKREDEIGKTLAEVFVEIEKETRHHKKGEIFLVKTRISLPGRRLVAQFRANDVFKAVVGVKEELKKEIEKYKFKKIDKTRRQQRKVKDEIEI